MRSNILFPSFVYFFFNMLAVKPKGEFLRTPRNSKKINCLWESVKKTWIEFANCSTVQGVVYVVDPDGTVVTKVLWIVILIMSFITSNVLVKTFWERYRSNPTRMNVETNHAPIEDLAFPAITFCSTHLISYLKARDLVETLSLPENLTTSTILEYFENTAGFSHRIEFDTDELDKLQEVLTANRYDVPTAMVNMRLSCRDLLFKCRWEGRVMDCMRLFHRSITFNGFCCSFNLAEYNKNNFKPIRPRYFGMGRGLSVVLQPNIDNNAISQIYSEGTQLLIHESNTYPSDTTNQKMLPLQAETAISIKPSITWCSNQVRALSISARECVFNEEYNLQYFTQYREANCEVECRMLKTMDKCECLPYFYPNYVNFPVCNFTRISCLVSHYFELHETQKGAANSSCDCPASCNGIFYDIFTDSSPLILKNFSIDPFYNGVNDTHLVVHIFMDSQVYRRMRRDLLTNIIGLVANFGGVYSLFLGLSVIGLFEFIYFVTIRMFKNYQSIKLEQKQKSLVNKLAAAEDVPPSYNKTMQLNLYTTTNSSYNRNNLQLRLLKNEMEAHM